METMIYVFGLLALAPFAFLGAIFAFIVLITAVARVVDSLASLYRSFRGLDEY